MNNHTEAHLKYVKRRIPDPNEQYQNELKVIASNRMRLVEWRWSGCAVLDDTYTTREGLHRHKRAHSLILGSAPLVIIKVHIAR